MRSDEANVRGAIAEQAGEWLVASDDGPLDERDSEALAAWLKTSPVHIEEFLGVSVIARDLKEARADPGYSLEAVLARARAEDDSALRPLWPRVAGAVWGQRVRRWSLATVMTAACAVLSVGLLGRWNVSPVEHPSAADGTAAMHLETRHGEKLSRRLADNSVLHLNTDSAVTIRYSKTERLVTLISGQADFEVAHEPDRAFRVFAGAAEIVDLGTKFDVRLEHDATVVTVVDGRVAVGPSPMSVNLDANSSQNRPSRFVQLGADQQVVVTEGKWPATPIAVDAQRTTAWLHRQIAFDHEPLERVAADYNRYSSKPVEIATPALRSLLVSGVFATDDSDAFVAFLRSLKGVRVEVTETQIRVW